MAVLTTIDSNIFILSTLYENSIMVTHRKQICFQRNTGNMYYALWIVGYTYSPNPISNRLSKILLQTNTNNFFISFSESF